MYLTQALHEVSLKGGPEGPLEVEVAALLQSLSSYVTLEDIKDFCFFFLLYREYVRVRNDVMAEENEAKLIPGQEVPRMTVRLCFLCQQTNAAVMGTLESFPGAIPPFPETQAGPLQARQAPLRFV